ncbi:MAG: 50S ribosomal protein L32 [Clostridiales bacterium]|jgi:large subunit ribosomal protein L32|nr:50S ribosomal protein L32 [Clostridiales bacterium]
MSIGPKGKISKSRGRMRRASSWKIAMPNLVKCSKCGELMVPHMVCKACGSYKKQSVLEVK